MDVAVIYAAVIESHGNEYRFRSGVEGSVS